VRSLELAIKYLAGERIIGTAAERAAMTSTSFGIPAWQELDRVTLGSGGYTMDTSTFTTKPYLMILHHIIVNSSQANAKFRFNNDSGSNYSRRRNVNGGSDATSTSGAEIDPWTAGSDTAFDNFAVGFVTNSASSEKLCKVEQIGRSTAGSGTAPSRSEVVAKWANTSDQINRVLSTNSAPGEYSTGSELVVLGYDPADTATGAGFWEELASVELGSSGSTLDSGTIAAKKYLWVQASLENTGNLDNCKIRFNGSSSGDYSYRKSSDGGSDSTNVDDSGIGFMATNVAQNLFVNFFIINESATEKLSIGHTVRDGGAGVGNAPNRKEWVGKWDITGSQITSIQAIEAGSGSFDTGSIIKVWGSN
jgi:hypothetical protein